MCNEEIRNLKQIDCELERFAKTIEDSKEFNESPSFQKNVKQLLASIENNVFEIALMLKAD